MPGCCCGNCDPHILDLRTESPLHERLEGNLGRTSSSFRTWLTYLRRFVTSALLKPNERASVDSTILHKAYVNIMGAVKGEPVILYAFVKVF